MGGVYLLYINWCRRFSINSMFVLKPPPPQEPIGTRDVEVPKTALAKVVEVVILWYFMCFIIHILLYTIETYACINIMYTYTLHTYMYIYIRFTEIMNEYSGQYYYFGTESNHFQLSKFWMYKSLDDAQAGDIGTWSLITYLTAIAWCRDSKISSSKLGGYTCMIWILIKGMMKSIEIPI